MARFEKGNKRGNRFTNATATECGRRGAEVSNRVQKEKKLMKEICEEKLIEILENGKSCQENLLDKARDLSFSSKTTLKDILAFLAFMRDTSGQKPVEKVAQTDSTGLDIQIVDYSKVKDDNTTE